MDARFYNSDEIDIERLAQDLMNVYMAQGYQTQQIGNKDSMLVQIKKGGDLEALVGLQAALSLTLQHTGGGTLAAIGQQKWLDKAAVGAVGIIGFAFLWPLALTAGAGALRQASLGNQVLNIVDGLVHQQRPSVQVGPVPPQFMPQGQQSQWSMPNFGQQTPYYTPPAQQPPYYTPPAQQQPQTPPNYGQPAYTPPVQQQPQTPPTYTPPQPTYTPPPVQPRPEVPVYTPPVNPPTPPVQRVEQAYVPPVQPKPQPAPEPPPYVPPVTQNPAVPPQPKVTYVQSTEQDTVVAPPQPKAQPQYYIPSNQQASAQQQASASQPTIANSPIQGQSSVDATVPWGVLTFASGQQVSLTGASALVGRYDHDLGGDKPAVDLSDQQGADTTSRAHAVFEHTGNSYTLTDLNSTNSTRINNKRLDPDKATPLNDGDTILFGKVSATFKKL